VLEQPAGQQGQGQGLAAVPAAPRMLAQADPDVEGPRGQRPARGRERLDAPDQPAIQVDSQI
jgi:hypothetical protein